MSRCAFDYSRMPVVLLAFSLPVPRSSCCKQTPRQRSLASGRRKREDEKRDMEKREQRGRQMDSGKRTQRREGERREEGKRRHTLNNYLDINLVGAESVGRDASIERGIASIGGVHFNFGR